MSSNTANRHRRNIPRNTVRSNISTSGTTRALIERSRSANSRNSHINSMKDCISSASPTKSPSVANKYAPNIMKKGVFTKANERKKRNVISKSGFSRASPKVPPSNVSSAYELKVSSDNTQEELIDGLSEADFIDINNVDDIIDDKDLTETSIDDEGVGNAALKSKVNEMTVEFIGCSPSGRSHNYLSDEFNFIQTLPRSYKIQNNRKNNDMEKSNQNISSTELNEEQNNDQMLLSRFDMTKSVKSILTVQEKLTQDFPSLPPQVIVKFSIKFWLSHERL